jgi:Na+:H+ antiporter, NhaA family
MENSVPFKLTALFIHFFKSEKAGGFILIGCTILSLLLANQGTAESWLHFWHSRIDLSFSTVKLDYSLEEWVNDGLMAIFFLMVGLEIERELYAGELSQFTNALLPVLAAIGGMVIPAAIFFLFNNGRLTQSGIGIPMATDIAFSLGMLSLLGNRIHPSVKIFLTALAIIDDLGAIIIIAIFYTKGFIAINLFIAIGIFAFLLVLKKLKVRHLSVYLIAGIIMWYFMLKSGVHSTISGILLAFAIPFDKNDAVNPSHKLQKTLHHPVSYFILPLFALANTGIPFAKDWLAHLYSPNSAGIILGLILGKPGGILLFCWVAVKLKFCRLPEGLGWKILLGTGILAGIGFTMSIFITNLAFSGQQDIIEGSKIAVLAGSLLAALAGIFFLFACTAKIKIPNRLTSND